MSQKQDHKRWKKQFNSECLKRDGNKCVFCDIDVELDVHHITDRHELSNGGYVKSNGITVCAEHHWECEQFHISGISSKGFSPEELYSKIGSSYEQAYIDSIALS